MKKLQNDFTTPEQSKRLLELGVPADSANCYMDSDGSNVQQWPGKYPLSEFIDHANNRYKEERYCYCWTSGRLMEIFDTCYFGIGNDDEWPKTNDMSAKAGSIVNYIVGIYDIAAKENGFDFSKLEE